VRRTFTQGVWKSSREPARYACLGNPHRVHAPLTTNSLSAISGHVKDVYGESTKAITVFRFNSGGLPGLRGERPRISRSIAYSSVSATALAVSADTPVVRARLSVTNCHA
jgi:hypothetical protein